MSPDERDYAKMMYEEHAEHARLHEELRTNATGIFFALVSGLLAVTALGDGAQPLVGIMICLASIVGCLITWTHYRRFDLHRELLKAFRDKLAKDLPIAKAAAGLREDYEKRFPAARLPLHALFVVAFLLTLLIGIVITAAPFVPWLSRLISVRHAPH
jgi:hypothetical protein